MNAKERAECLKKMTEISDSFYYNAQRIGFHSFLEFNGLLTEYIKICTDAHRAGIDFTDCSKHTGTPLPIKDYQINYINEKLECIFQGATFGKEAAKDGQV